MNGGANQLLSCRHQVIESDIHVDHALKATLELDGDVLSGRREHFVHRPVMA